MRVRWPADCKDANDVLMNYDADTIKGCIEYAKPFPIKGLIELEDFEEDLEFLYHSGFQPGESPGWASLGRHYTVKPGEITLITGIPGHGKSSLIDALTVNLATHSDWNFAICSPEMLPPERHTALYVEKFTGKPFSDQPGCLSSAEYAHAKMWFADHFCFVMPDDNPSLDEIFNLARIAIQRKGIKGLVIDPWSEITHTMNSDFDQEYYSKTLSKIRSFARKMQIHIWLIAHPTKLNPMKDGEYPVPTPYNVAGSAHFRNKFDNCLTVFIPSNTEGGEALVEVHIQKIKFREVGRVGKIKLRWNRLNGRYSEAE
jgi:twinkle protein